MTKGTAKSGRAGALVVIVADRWGRPVAQPTVSRWLTRTAPRQARGTVGLILVTDVHMRRLNRAYRRKDAVTDVLSFPAGENSPARINQGARGPTPTRSRSAASRLAPAAGANPYLGDIVIARGVAARHARAAGHSLTTELRVLALHGLLHLLGYDHARDAGEMARVERRLRRRGGLREGLIERP